MRNSIVGIITPAIASCAPTSPFKVVNFLELVGEAMGVEKPDLFKQWKMMQDIDRILAEVAAQAAAAGAGLGKRPRSAPRQYAG
jgi:hypothetical protein